jgi:hypothetical protein
MGLPAQKADRARRPDDTYCTWMARREKTPGARMSFPARRGSLMYVDYLNAAMGLMFLAVWALIWQFATNEA